MNLLQKQSLIEMVLYILTKTRGADIYHVLKVLYFAEQKHLVDWGTRLVRDDFRAYEYGPVPDQLYKASHGNDKYGYELVDMFKSSIRFAGNEAPNVLLPKREPDMSRLSQAAVECLDDSIAKNIGLPFGVLMEKSHDSAWQAARQRMLSTHDDLMFTTEVAQAAGASPELLQFIGENEQVELELGQA